MERSGTHWVTALLNAHPEVSCFPTMPFHKETGEYSQEIGEVHFFNTLASLEPDTKNLFTRSLDNYLTKHQKLFADLVDYKDKVSKEELYKMFTKRYNEVCESQRQDKKIVGEATPAYVFHLDFIDRLYPGIKKLCIIRDPKDRIVSWHRSQVKKGNIKTMVISDQFALDYCQNRIKKEYESLLAYKNNVHCFTYEDLSNHGPETVKNILEYLEVKIDDQIIDKMIAEADFKKLNAKDSGKSGRVRGEESLKSHYRKGIVGDWKNCLTSDQAKMIDDTLADLQAKVFNKYNIK
jgi:hypothetical protein